MIVLRAVGKRCTGVVMTEAGEDAWEAGKDAWEAGKDAWENSGPAGRELLTQP
jgi:hypothetical protein